MATGRRPILGEVRQPSSTSCNQELAVIKSLLVCSSNQACCRLYCSLETITGSCVIIGGALWSHPRSEIRAGEEGVNWELLLKAYPVSYGREWSSSEWRMEFMLVEALIFLLIQNTACKRWGILRQPRNPNYCGQLWSYGFSGVEVNSTSERKCWISKYI